MSLNALFGNEPAPAPSWFDSVVDAVQGNGGPPYCPPGLCVGRIDVWKEVKTQKGLDCVICEFTVTESATAAIPVASQLCISVIVPGQNNMGGQDLQAWLTAIFAGMGAERGSAPPVLSKEVLGQIIGPAQVLTGVQIKIQATVKPGKTFTNYAVEYVPGGTVLGLVPA